jgi:hypothetical protein
MWPRLLDRNFPEESFTSLHQDKEQARSTAQTQKKKKHEKIQSKQNSSYQNNRKFQMWEPAIVLRRDKSEFPGTLEKRRKNIFSSMSFAKPKRRDFSETERERRVPLRFYEIIEHNSRVLWLYIERRSRCTAIQTQTASDRRASLVYAGGRAKGERRRVTRHLLGPPLSFTGCETLVPSLVGGLDRPHVLS